MKGIETAFAFSYWLDLFSVEMELARCRALKPIYLLCHMVILVM